ncbi:deoxynucleoside kinase [Mycoplasma corogypsi]|uniref:deoxynucleoside kinase n=1 Tax=Mycoplasma corogypsi TaxID=2106 RepID=UPI0038731436
MLIGISGMIGSGKSVLSKKLVNHYKKNSLLLQEFSDDDEVFTTMLKWLYERKPNFDATFQVYVLEYHLGLVEKIKAKFKKREMDQNKDIIFLDRFVAEHYVFATVNLKHCEEKIKKAYDSFFNCMVTKDNLPEYAIFLDVSFENFKERLFNRGRQVEIDSFDKNKKYFKNLLAIYKETFIKVAEKFGVKYQIIDTNGKSELEVFHEAKMHIDNFMKG